MENSKLIVVLGMHRSGTSTITRGLQVLGVKLGDRLIPPVKGDNDKGYWEDIDLTSLNIEMLNVIDSDWQNLAAIEPKDVDTLHKEGFFLRANELLQKKVASMSVFGFKDPRTAKLMPFWKGVFDHCQFDVSYVIAIRHPHSVAKSLERRGGMETTQSHLLWLGHLINSLAGSAGYKRVLVDYDCLMHSPDHELNRMAKHLDLEIDPSELQSYMTEFIDPGLRHTAFKPNDFLLDGACPPIVREAYIALLDVASDKISLDDLECDVVRWLGEFGRLKSPLLLLDKLYAKITERDIQLLEIGAQLHERNMSIAFLEEQLDLIKKSFSWLITKPVRFTGRLVRGDFSQAKQLLKKTPIPRLLYPIRNRLRSISSALSPFNSKQNNLFLTNSSRYRSEVLFSPQHSPAAIASENLPLIDISVVTYNNTNWLDKFVSSLVQQNYPISLINLIFVDNGSTDDSLQKLNDIKGQYTTKFNSIAVYSQLNKGFGAGHNFAISKSSAQFVLVTNIDLEFEQTAIKQTVCIAIKDKKEVASWEFRQKPYEHPKHYDPVSLDTSWSSHACVLLRRSAYNQVGGYESKIFMYGEDVELSYRLRNYGFRLRYIPSSVVYHYTYQEAEEIKPLQFGGSTLANMYIRLRYGTTSDCLAGVFLQAALIIKGGGFKGSRLIAMKNFLAIIKNTCYFLSDKEVKPNHFPFRGFDYEMTRDGAFYQPKKLNNLTPLVTIITRTYKGRENWLKECISSVINQTYPNIQHVIVEDGGDTMATLVKRVQEHYDASYQVIYSDLPKKGRSFAGNKGLSIAKGEYLMFLDDDDLLYSDHVETLVAELIDTTCAAAYSLAWEVASEVENVGGELKYTERSYHLPGSYRQEFSREKLLTSNYIPIQSILFQRELYDKLGGFDETMDYLEDWNLWTKYSRKYDFIYIPKTTSLYRVPYSQSEQVKRKALIDAAYKAAVEKQKNFLRH